MRKTTRNSLCLLFGVLLLLSVPTVCFADLSVYIPEYNVTVSVPEGTYIATQSTDASDLFWDVTGLDCDTFLNELKEDNIYLIAVSKDGSYEMDLYCEEGEDFQDLYDFAQYEDAALLEGLRKRILADAENSDHQADEFEIYHAGSLKFFAFTNTFPSGEAQKSCRTYMTIYNGVRFLLSYISSSGELTAQDEAVIRRVVDSMQFDTHLEPEEQSTKTSFAQYAAAPVGIAIGLFIRSALRSRREKKECAASTSQKDE